MDKFPFAREAFLTTLPKFIELELIHPASFGYSAEELFYGAVLMVLYRPEVKVTAEMNEVLSDLTACWGRAH